MSVMVADVRARFSADTSGAESGVKSLGQKIDDLSRKVDHFSSEAAHAGNEAKGAFSGLGGAFDDMGSRGAGAFNRIGDIIGGNLIAGGIQKLASGLVDLTQKAVALGASFIQASNEFNAGLANVASLGVPTQHLEAYKSALQDMSVETGKDTKDLTGGLYQVVSAFGDTADSAKILDINAKAATAGVASTVDSINLTSAVTKGYGDTSAAAVQHVTDLALKTVELGQTTFPELAASVGKVVPLSNQLGISQQELFAVLATGSGVTGTTSEVATQYRGILQSLMAPTDTTTKLIKAMGFSSGEAMLKQLGLSKTVGVMVAASKRANVPLQEFISQIEGQTLALALSGPLAKKYQDNLAGMANAAGKTDDAFKAQTSGVNALGFKLQQAGAWWGVFKEKAGDALGSVIMAFEPMIEPMIGALGARLEAFLPRITAWAEQVKAKMKTAYDASGGGAPGVVAAAATAVDAKVTYDVQTHIQTINWGDFVGKLDWKNHVGQLIWGNYVTTLDWNNKVVALNWGGYVTILDWGKQVAVLNWGGYVTKLDWGNKVVTLNWGDYVTKFDWGNKVLTLDWGGYLTKIDWSSKVAALKWGDYISVFDWGNKAAVLNWGDYVTKVDLPGKVATFNWNDHVGNLDWSGKVPTLTWGDKVYKLEWANYVKSFLFTDVVHNIDWGKYISTLSWTSVIKTSIDWATWVPALSWNLFIKTIDWTTWLTTLDWKSIFPSTPDLGAKVPTLDWKSIITTFPGWAADIGAFTWSSFVSKLAWPSEATTFTWSSWIEKLDWPDLAWPGWSSFVPNVDWSSLIPSFTWSSFITGVNLKALIPSFPGWSSLLSGLGITSPGTNANGTDNWRGGWTWVGEKGPELLNLPEGSKILSNENSRKMIGQHADGNTSVPAGLSSSQASGFNKFINALTVAGDKTAQAQERAANKTAKAFDNVAEKIKSGLQSMLDKVPGLFSPSQVTDKDMQLSKAGLYQNNVDEILRRVNSAANNEKDQSRFSEDIAKAKEALNRIGITASDNIKTMAAQFQQAWSDQSLFSNKANLSLLDMGAVQRSIQQQQQQATGKANILQLFGIQPDQVQTQAMAAAGQVVAGLAAGVNTQQAGLADAIIKKAAAGITPDTAAPIGAALTTGISSSIAGAGKENKGAGFGDQLIAGINSSLNDSTALDGTGQVILQKVAQSWKTSAKDADIITGITSAMNTELASEGTINALMDVGGKVAKYLKAGIGRYFEQANLADDVAKAAKSVPSTKQAAPGKNANGTDFWRGGLTWVGERGPELVNLPRGSQVIPSTQSYAMAAGNQTQVIQHNYYTVENKIDIKQVAREVFREAQRLKG